MHNVDLIITLTEGMAVALILGYITHRLGLSPIVGYLLAGIVVGPHTPGFVANHDLAEQLAEIGVILLMFGVGLQFHLNELLAVRRVAVPGSLVQVTVATLLGVLLGLAVGWPVSSGLIYGLAISVASTVVLLRVLADNNALHTSTGHVAVGWLVIEDLFTVVVLVLLPKLFGEGASLDQAPMALAMVVVKVTLLVFFVFVIGGRVIPWLLIKIAGCKSRELFTLTVLVVALGIAVGSARLFDVSMELGAFLAGMVVGRSEFSFRAASEALPMRDAFAVLFFVSVGMLLDPSGVLATPGLLLGTLGIILIGKPLAAFLIVVLLRYPLGTALGASIALAQIGEFSFILAKLGVELGMLPDVGHNALIAAAIVSISLNPVLYKLVGPAEAWMKRQPRVRAWLSRGSDRVMSDHMALDDGESHDPRDRAVIVGYGPVGKTVARLLTENNVEPTVIDMNLETVQAILSEKGRAVYGDATQRGILVGAGLADSHALILSAEGLRGDKEIIRLARELNPTIRVLARSTYLSQIDELRRAGADAVFSAEGEIALAFTEAVLTELGATPEQIDRERQRVHEELGSREEIG